MQQLLVHALRQAIVGVAMAGALGIVVIVFAPLPASAACVARVASNDVLWIRNLPNPKAGKVAGIPHNSCEVDIHRDACVGQWCYVTYRGASGWANSWFIR